MKRLSFTVPGEPVPKSRPRFTAQGGKVRAYSPASSAAYETAVGFHAAAAMRAQGISAPMTGAVAVQLQAFMAKPKKPRAGWHTARPDLDNIAKAALDGLNRVAFVDDAQVAGLIALKAYSDTPRLEVAIAEIAPQNASKRSHKARTQGGCYPCPTEAENAPERLKKAFCGFYDEENGETA